MNILHKLKPAIEATLSAAAAAGITEIIDQLDEHAFSEPTQAIVVAVIAGLAWLRAELPK